MAAPPPLRIKKPVLKDKLSPEAIVSSVSNPRQSIQQVKQGVNLNENIPVILTKGKSLRVRPELFDGLSINTTSAADDRPPPVIPPISPPDKTMSPTWKDPMAALFSFAGGETPQTSESLSFIMGGFPGSLYIGSRDAAEDAQSLLAKGVTHVVSLMEEKLSKGTKAKKKKIKYLYYKVDDEPSERQTMADILAKGEAFSFIEEGLNAGSGVLVNCEQGISRSATLVIAYLITQMKMTLAAAYNHTRGKRLISPNIGFLKALARLELDFTKNSTVKELTESEHAHNLIEWKPGEDF